MKYDDYAAMLGFQKIKNVYVLNKEGYSIYLRDWQYMVLNIPSFYIPLDKEITKDAIKALQVEALGNACAQASLGNKADTLIITLPEGNKIKKIDLMNEILNNVIECLKDMGYLPMHICPICKKDAEYDLFGSHYCPIHKECRSEYLSKLEELNKKTTGFNIKYVLALLFVLIGIGLGLILPILLTINLHDYFTGVLALIPILATLGLFLSKAPSKKWLKITVGLLVFIAIATFLAISIPYMITFTESKDTFSYFFQNGWVGFRKVFFGGILSLGGFGGAKFLDKFKKDYSKEIEALKQNEKEND